MTVKKAADSKAGIDRQKRNLLLDIILSVLVLFLAVPLLSKIVTGYATFFGYKPIYILTDSMEPVIPAGSWVVGVPARGEEIAVGDVAAYRKENDTELQPIIIHRVVGITESGFIFQGDNNELPDSQSQGRPDYVQDYISRRFAGIKISYLFYRHFK